jgi:hypothetical protein
MDIATLKSSLEKYCNRLPELTPTKLIDFEYDEKTLELVYTIAFFSFAELQHFFEDFSKNILNIFKDKYMNNNYHISYPILTLCLKKGLDKSNERKFLELIKDINKMVREACSNHMATIDRNSGINKDYLNNLFSPLGLIIEDDGGILTRFYSNLYSLSNIRNEGAHKSIDTSLGHNHTPQMLKEIIKELLSDIDNFYEMINDYIMKTNLACS